MLGTTSFEFDEMNQTEINKEKLKKEISGGRMGEEKDECIAKYDALIKKYIEKHKYI